MDIWVYKHIYVFKEFTNYPSLKTGVERKIRRLR